MKTLILVSGFLLLFGLSGNSHAQSFSAEFLLFSEKSALSEDSEPLRVCDDNGVSHIEVTYDFPGTWVITENVKGTDYQHLNIEGFGKLLDVGKPALPVYNDIVAIPEGAVATVIILETEYKKLSAYLVHPALEPASDEVGAPEPEFVIDEEFYNTDIIYPDKPVKITEIVKLRGIPLATIQVCPIQYNPAAKELTVYSKIKYKVEFTGGTRFLNLNEHSEHFLTQFPNYILNGKVIKEEIRVHLESDKGQRKDRDGKNYILITHNDFLDQANDLAIWKRQLGYSVELVSRSSWTASEVENEVHTMYNSWSTKPDYLLILGDHGYVPAEMLTTNDGTEYPSDLYFVCMDGGTDYVPDMGKGRIPVNDISQASTVVDKIIQYEKFPITDADFYRTSTHCAQFQESDNAGYAERRFAQTAEDVLQYLTNEQGYTVNRVYKTGSSTSPTNWNNGTYSNGEPLPGYLRKPEFPWDGDANDIRNEINDGRFYILHRDHGYTAGWGTPSYDSDDVGNLSNGDKLPVVFSLNCLTGAFHNYCFCEAFIRKENGGAVGIFGASKVSYSGYNDAFCMGLFDAIWPEFVVEFTGSGGYNNPDINYHDPMYCMGDVLNQGLTRMRGTWGNSRETHEFFHYFGDPAMKIWTDVPLDITATHDDIIIAGNNQFIINSCSCPDATATLVYNNELIGKTQLSGGTGTISFNGIDTPGAQVILTISKHNYRPYIDNLNVIVSNEPYLTISFDNVSDDDNSNGLLDPGENANLNITCANVGTVASANATASVTATGPNSSYITINTNPVSLGSLGASSSEPVTFNITVDPGTPLDTEVEFTFDLTDGTYSANMVKTFIVGYVPSYDMQNNEITTCVGKFFDPGGEDASYTDELEIVTTIRPSNAGSMVTVTFISFDVEDEPDCNYDYLEIFDGESVSDPLIGKYCGTDSPGTVTASNFAGALTFHFHSDPAVTNEGWEAMISCGENNTPYANFTANNTSVVEGNSVVFTDLSVNSPVSWSWIFEGGDPQTSTDQNPVVTYNTAGQYDVELTVYNSDGDSNTRVETNYITVTDYTTAFSLNFEACADWATTFDPWTEIDGDGGVVYGSNDYEFPNEATALSFMAFNPDLTEPSASGDAALQPHGGERFGAAFAVSPNNGAPNDDWLISPKIQLWNASSFSLWVKTYKDNWGLERFRVGVSTTDNDPSSFTIISPGTYEEAPAAGWEYKTYDISAYDHEEVYLAINCVSNDAWIFMIDDLSINTSGVEVEDIENEVEIKCYPNPTTGKLYINFSSYENFNSGITIFNMYGKIVKQVKYSGITGKTLDIDLSCLANGIYYLKIKTKDPGKDIIEKITLIK